jgi:hypothetical protein
MNEIEKAREEYRKEKLERARQLLVEGNKLRKSGKNESCYKCGKDTTLYLFDDKEVFNSGNEKIVLCRPCSEFLNPSEIVSPLKKTRKPQIRTGETSHHNAIKQEVARACIEVGYITQIEASGPGYRADVFAEKGQRRIAFEVQISPQTLEQTVARQNRYQEQGILGCWLFEKPPLGAGRKLPVFKVIISPDYCVQVQAKKISINQFIQDFLAEKITFHSKTFLEDRSFKFLNPQPVKVIFVDYECWKCQEPGHIYYLRCGCISEDGEIMNEEDRQSFQGGPFEREFRSEIVKAVREFCKSPDGTHLRLGQIKRRFSQTMETSYLSFGCYKCDAIFGDFYVSDYILNDWLILDEEEQEQNAAAVLQTTVTLNNPYTWLPYRGYQPELIDLSFWGYNEQTAIIP